MLVSFSVKNHSPLDVCISDGYIVNMDSPDFILFRRPFVVATRPERFETMMSMDSYNFLCYVGDMSDEKIVEKFKDLQINMLYETPLFNSLTYKCDLSESVFLSSFDEYEKIRDEVNSAK